MALYADPWLSEFGQPAFWRQIAQFDEKYTDEVETIYDQIRCRVMILWGEADRWIPVEDGRAFSARADVRDLHATNTCRCRRR